jgi:predicted nucleic acid-binding Zn ribbon protein
MSLACTVISLVPCKIVEEKPGLYPPRFIIEESDTVIPQLCHISTAVHYVYLDESRGMLQVKDPSDVVAKALVHDFVTSQLAVSDEVGPALWWVDSDYTLEQVVEKEKVIMNEMRQRQRKWFVNLMKMADDDWVRYRQHNVISDFQRKIGHILDLNPEDHEWMTPLALQQGRTFACPFCMTSLPVGSVICGTCHEIIDYKRKEQIEKELREGRETEMNKKEVLDAR